MQREVQAHNGARPDKFFLRVIGSGDQASITRIIDSFAQDNEALFDQLYQIQYYFRGALTRDDIWAMCAVEREKAIDFLNKRFKEVGELIKNRVPVFW